MTCPEHEEPGIGLKSTKLIITEILWFEIEINELVTIEHEEAFLAT